MSRPRCEVRSHTSRPQIDEAGSLVGHAAVFDQWTTIYSDGWGEMRERIKPGAFARAIKDQHDVRALFNHDPNFVLGRTTAGTLQLVEDDAGLRVTIAPPNTPTINDLVMAPIRRGDVDGMSFAFVATVGDEARQDNADGSVVIERGGDRLTVRWDKGRELIERELLDLDLYDVSAVTYPAYDGTSIAAHSRSIGFDAEAFVREVRASIKRPAPRRASYRQWLDATAVQPSALAQGSAAVGRKGKTHDSC
jgi:uncharacterized protein